MKRREFSRLFVLLYALFIITLVAAVFVGLVAVLQYSNLVSGSPLTTLEIMASIVGVSIVPLLAMGMAASTKVDQNK